MAQVSKLADSLFEDNDERIEFILEYSKEVQPLSLSLFVINPATWNVMKRKPDFPDRMLPMATIPRFYMRSSLRDATNTYGIKRSKSAGVTIEYGGGQFFFDGIGGDFYGILEESVAEPLQRSRSLLIPGDLSRGEMIPTYKKKRIRVAIGAGRPSVTVCPRPRRELDYRFSENPKLIHRYGIEIRSDDQTASLKVGFERASRLRGEVIVLLGKEDTTELPSHPELEYYVWLNSLARAIRIG